MTAKPGLWAALTSQMASRPAEAGMGLWIQVGLRPGKVWQQAEQETLILRSRGVNIWQAAGEATRGPSGPTGRGIWSRQDRVDKTGPAAQEDLWQSVGQETIPLARPGALSWMRVDLGRDLSRLRPVREDGWALKELADSKGERYFVLQNSRQGNFLHLSPEHKLIWDMLDGDHSLQEIAMTRMAAYGALDVHSLLVFLETLNAKGFLASQEPDVYRSMGAYLQRPGPFRRWLETVRRQVFQIEIPIRGIDALVGWVYRRGARALFTVPGQVLLAVTSVVGMLAFVRLTLSGGLSAVRGGGESVVFGGLALFAARAAALFVHVSGHALTCKHYGRPIRRGGVLVYFLLPYFYVDTSDAWLEPRRRRIALTWAGPYAGFVLAGACSLAATIGPVPLVNGFLYQVALLSIVVSFVNINPLFKMDGYYMLMDWLEMPNLMDQSRAFLRRSLWGKLRRRETLTAQQRVYAVYGLLASAWAAIAVGAVLYALGSPVLTLLRGGLAIRP